MTLFKQNWQINDSLFRPQNQNFYCLLSPSVIYISARSAWLMKSYNFIVSIIIVIAIKAKTLNYFKWFNKEKSQDYKWIIPKIFKNTDQNTSKTPIKTPQKVGFSCKEGASHLLELKKLIREHNLKEKQMPIREPDLLIILTGGKMAYTRPDGVKIIPLGCLKE